jgi:hypothetical protein
VRERLDSWRGGPVRTAIVEFVERVTEEGSGDFVPPPERVAVRQRRDAVV